jgi:hypothetical protein
MSLEDQRLLSSYLPLLREVIPNAAAEIENDISAHSKQGLLLQIIIKTLLILLPFPQVALILFKYFLGQ